MESHVRVPSMPGQVVSLRTELRTGMVCLAAIVLLACTPPDFGGDPEPPELVLSPISASIYVGTSITIAVSGGTPGYTVSVDHGGTLTKVSGGWSFAADAEGLSTITVTDESVPEQTKVSRIEVNAAPADLTISPASITLQVGDIFQFDAVGGVEPYVFGKVSGPGTVTSGGLYEATAIGKAFVEVEDAAHVTDQAEVDVVDPAEWNTRINVDPGADRGNFASLALDGTVGAPQIAHWQKTANPKALRLARWTGTSWSCGYVTSDSDTLRISPSLALDASSHAHIAWHKGSDNSLRYLAWNGAGWDALGGSEVVVAANVGPHVSLALDGDGYPHIAFYDASGSYLNLMYAKWTGSAWDIQTADGDAADVGQHASLALDPATGYPRIAYYDASNGTLKYAYWTGSAWNPGNVIDNGSGDDVGQFTSLKITPDGSLRVAYYDVTNGDLKYAKNSGVGTAWTITTIASGGDVGQYASLALDPDSQYPRIAYYDATNGDLCYAAWNGTIWFSATVDVGPASGVDDVGTYASLAIDETAGPTRGLMRIAYYDATAFDLLYITEQ
jgi:hypothetical protein